MGMATLEDIVTEVTAHAPEVAARTHPRLEALQAFSGVVTGILAGAALWLGILGVVLSQR